MITIHNFRAGFATNSSSSHSVVLLPPGHSIGDKAPSYDGYGWDFFRLVSEEEKLRYLAAQFFLNYWNDEAMRDQVIEHFRRAIPSLDVDVDAEDPPVSVDHQSVYGLPTQFDPLIADAMLAIFRSPQVAVLGGNDNSDRDAAEEVGGTSIPLFDMLRNNWNRSENSLRLRRDGSYFVAYSRSDGTKIRFSFDDVEGGAYTKACAPELVDLKITDWCEKNCAFCYQSSTKQGRHAPLSAIRPIIAMLKEQGVFEVAIGGGEPTAHPDFATILREIHAAGMTPNFTTFSNRWLKNQEIVDAVKATVGGIGVSCLDVKGLELVREIAEAIGHDRYGGTPRVMAQHVFGAVPAPITAALLRAAFAEYIPVLLLGYKTVGFGAQYDRHDHEGVEVIIKLAMADVRPYGASLSVDTALVDQYPDMLTALSIPDALVTSPEGKFSCYVDAVEGLLGPSSYVSKDDMSPLPADADAFRSAFAAF